MLIEANLNTCLNAAAFIVLILKIDEAANQI